MDWGRLWKDVDDLSARLSRLFFLTGFSVGFWNLYQTSVKQSEPWFLVGCAAIAFLLTSVLALLQMCSAISVFWPRKDEALHGSSFRAKIGGVILVMILAIAIAVWTMLVFALLQTGLWQQFMSASL